MNYQSIFWSLGKKDLDVHKNRLQGGGKQSIGVFGLVPSTGAEIMKEGPL